MKDKIVYLIIGLLIIIAIALFTSNSDNLTADNHTLNLGDATFDNVVIKGTLTVGEGSKKITLTTDDKESKIIIQASDTVISISANDTQSVILLTPDALRKDINGVGITSMEKGNKISSDITIIDTDGIKQIGSTDKIELDRNFNK